MAEPEEPTHGTLAPFMALLLDCVKAELEARHLSVPGFAAVHWGQVPMWHLDGDNCGELYVAAQPGFPTINFPVLLEGPMKARPRIAWPLQVGVARCVKVVDENNQPPDEDEQWAYVEQFNDDAAAMLAAICKCAGENTRNWSLLPYQQLGPEGGAGGGFWTVVVEV